MIKQLIAIASMLLWSVPAYYGKSLCVICSHTYFRWSNWPSSLLNLLCACFTCIKADQRDSLYAIAMMRALNVFLDQLKMVCSSVCIQRSMHGITM